MQFSGQQAEDKSYLCHHMNCPRFSKDYLIINYGENKIPNLSETEVSFQKHWKYFLFKKHTNIY